MANYWERLRAQQEADRIQSLPQRSDGPWWAQNTTIGSTAQNPVPTTPAPSQSHTEADGHDYSKADHLKSQANCPNCGSTDYMKASANVARRCWDCGHNEGREVHDPTLPAAITMEGPAQRAMQTDAGGAVINNYHIISTASEAVDRVG